MWAIYFSFSLIVGIVIFKTCFIFARKKCNTRLKDKQIIFKLVEDSKDVIYHFEVKPELKCTYISPSLEKFLGKGAIEEAFEDAYAPFERIHPDDYENLCKKIKDELNYNQMLLQRWKDNDGKYRWFEEYTTPIYKNGQLVALQGIMRNIDEKIEFHQNIEYRITHDALTGIYNREYFDLAFTKLDEQKNVSVAIILCDLDNLKYTNDHFGHIKGDTLIEAAARLLNQFSSDTITVARLGGDEFVLLVEEMSKEEVKPLLDSIFKAIESNNGSGTDIIIKMSIGFAFSPKSIGQMTDLFSQADKKMYEDKLKRKRLFGEIERGILY